MEYEKCDARRNTETLNLWSEQDKREREAKNTCRLSAFAISVGLFFVCMLLLLGWSCSTSEETLLGDSACGLHVLAAFQDHHHTGFLNPSESSPSQQVKLLFQAYTDTFPKEESMQRPNIFPHRISHIDEFRDHILNRLDDFVHLEDMSLHRKAYQKVHQMFAKLSRGENITIAAIGGSPTARGRFMFVLEDFFNALKLTGKVNTHNMGHGAHGGNHATFLLDEFLPKDTDLVIWDFSINDSRGPGIGAGSGGYKQLSAPIKERIALLAQQNFLRMVGNSLSQPAVLMVHLWTDLESFAENRLNLDLFPHLLGHVNMDKLRGSFHDKADRLAFTTSDLTHPSADGDLIIGELLKRAVMRALATKPVVSSGGKSLRSKGSPNQSLQVDCLAHTPKLQARFQGFVDFLATTSQFPRSWSLVKPTVDSSFKLTNTRMEDEFILTTRASAGRNDRRYVVYVPHCDSSSQPLNFVSTNEETSRSTYFVISSDRLQRYTSDQEKIPNHNYELLEFTFSDGQGLSKVLKSASRSRDKWRLNGQDIDVVHGAGPFFMCGLQIGRAFKIDKLGFRVATVSVCARGSMTLQWFSVL